MLNFGKYKGKTLSQVFACDVQYVTWMANNIPDIDSKLDDEDKTTLFKYAFPYEYIKEKYGYFIQGSNSFEHRNEDEIIDILKKEGFLKCAYSYIDEDEIMGVEGTVKTVYASTFGSTWGCGRCDATHYDLIGTICSHLNKAEEWFKD